MSKKLTSCNDALQIQQNPLENKVENREVMSYISGNIWHSLVLMQTK